MFPNVAGSECNQESVPRGDRESDSPTRDLRTAVHEFERRHISEVLTSVAGNKTEAARILGIGLSSLYRKLDELGLVREEPSQASANCEECSGMSNGK